MAIAEFGKRVRKIRDGENLSQSAAAKIWGVNLRTLQDWELGRSAPPPFFAKCVLFYLCFRNKARK